MSRAGQPPDDLTYPDTGCPDLGIPSCLTCPLPECRYLLPPSVPQALLRYLAVRPYLAAGYTAAEAARAAGVTTRTVFRLKHYAEQYPVWAGTGVP